MYSDLLLALPYPINSSLTFLGGQTFLVLPFSKFLTLPINWHRVFKNCPSFKELVHRLKRGLSQDNSGEQNTQSNNVWYVLALPNRFYVLNLQRLDTSFKVFTKDILKNSGDYKTVLPKAFIDTTTSINIFEFLPQDKVLSLKQIPRSKNTSQISKLYYNDLNHTVEIFLNLKQYPQSTFKSLIQKEPRFRRLLPYIKQNGYILVLKQPFYSTLLSFIISTNNNIKRIRKIVWQIITRYINDTGILGFPVLEYLYNLTIKDWQAIGTGYRAKFLIEVFNRENFAEFLRNFGKVLRNFQFDLETDIQIKPDTFTTLFNLLQTLPGVGPKVADCVLAFSLNIPTVTPIDIWAKRYINLVYKLPLNRSYMFYREFLSNHFKEYTLFAGQYLFELVRLNMLESF